MREWLSIEIANQLVFPVKVGRKAENPFARKGFSSLLKGSCQPVLYAIKLVTSRVPRVLDRTNSHESVECYVRRLAIALDITKPSPNLPSEILADLAMGTSLSLVRLDRACWRIDINSVKFHHGIFFPW